MGKGKGEGGKANGRRQTLKSLDVLLTITTITIYFIHPSREIKAVIQCYAHNKELNCTYLNNSKS